jgi:hypothetical protein
VKPFDSPERVTDEATRIASMLDGADARRMLDEMNKRALLLPDTGAWEPAIRIVARLSR